MKTPPEDQQQEQRHPYYDEHSQDKEDRIRSLFSTLSNTHQFDHYDDFKKHIVLKEEELWKMFENIKKQSDYHLKPTELESALKEAGHEVTPNEVNDLFQMMDVEGHGYINFENWRNYLLHMPHKTTLTEIYRYYQNTTQLTADAEVVIPHTDEAARNAYKYLTAGAIAGCVSRTCTAPLDRLKVYLITHTDYKPHLHAKPTTTSSSTIVKALKTIYSQGGFRSLFVGNGLNVVKIVPESAIKFYVFETSKAIMAQLTGAQDKNGIPVSARFLAGGMAGLCAQFCIYPLETLKTRIMSGQGTASSKVVLKTVRDMYRTGGARAFWPGLLLSLVGVFPYQALDMGIYETLKVTYLQSMDNKSSSTGKKDNGEKVYPNVFVLWMCGMASGSIGATSVYPLNMIRTRLQAQGTPAHPYTYTSAWDVARKTYRADGVRGFYKGLGPTLFKVVPSISISYAVYEFSKRSLGIS